MPKKATWLSRTLIITGLIMVAVFAIAINRGPLLEGFQPYHPDPDARPSLCLWCDDETPPRLSDYLGTALIMLLVMAIPSGHIAVIILVAQQLKQASLHPTSSKLPPCPHCERPIHRGWRACPACGNRLETPTPKSASPSAYVDPE